VGLVAGGAISLEGAVPMIMGANIGTALTSMLVSLGHINRPLEFRRAFGAASLHGIFNLTAVVIMLPLELFTGFLTHSSLFLTSLFEGAGGMVISNPLNAATQPTIEFASALTAHNPLALLVLMVLLTFATLVAIVKLLRSLVLAKVEAFFQGHLFKTAGRAMLFGFLLTVAVQSSSIPTSLVIPLAGAGILNLMQIYPFSLGTNVGTTITAMLAALSTANTTAITVAFCHLVFNVCGILFIWLIPPIRRIPLVLAERLAAVSMRRRSIPVLIIALVFFIIPILMVLIAT
jgi:solute carrier family 34 (sodium-dependent phosphate cotransporter)